LAALPLSGGFKLLTSAPVHTAELLQVIDKLMSGPAGHEMEQLSVRQKKAAPEGAASYLPLGDNSDQLVIHVRNKFP
jgi:hypothetical protein